MNTLLQPGWGQGLSRTSSWCSFMCFCGRDSKTLSTLARRTTPYHTVHASHRPSTAPSKEETQPFPTPQEVGAFPRSGGFTSWPRAAQFSIHPGSHEPLGTSRHPALHKHLVLPVSHTQKAALGTEATPLLTFMPSAPRYTAVQPW